ncbi:MAG: hypothetical protein ABGY42_07770 [bacterium]
MLKQRHGTVYVSFAEPVSLRDTLGGNFDRFAGSEGDAEIEDEQRRFVQKLGFRILRDVNEVAVVGATSLSATVLLSAPETGVCFADFARDSRALAELLRWRGANFTPSLERNLGRDDFDEILTFLQSTGLIEIEGDGHDRVMRIAKGKRIALDFYKNNSIHFFLTASLVAHALMRGVAREDLEDEIWWWLEIFRWEFPLPEHSDVGPRINRILEYFDAHGVAFAGPGRSVPLVRALGSILENFREAYWIVARAIGQLGEESVTEADWMQQIARSFDAARLLGEVVRPEAGNPIVFKNATSRFAEMGLLMIEKGRTPRDRRIARIADAPGAVEVLRELGAGLLVPGG